MTFLSVHIAHKTGEGVRIDYIFVNEIVNVKTHSILSVFKGDYYLSDHMPVFSEITIP
ncbi:MAG: hypothetical protein WD059_06815 [Balneolaceae bacterium]